MKNFSMKPKIILVPYPAQGHVTPMLMLASAFHRRGFLPVIITPSYIHRQISPQIEARGEIRCISMPDGIHVDTPRDFFAVETALETTMPCHLRRILGELAAEVAGSSIGSGAGLCMVVDLLASPAIEVGRECGIPVAGFWPAMFATYHLISDIPEMIRSGVISDTGIPQQQLGSTRWLPNQPLLSPEELPWLIGTPSARKARFKFWTRTLARASSLQWLLINSFPEDHSIKKPKPAAQISPAAQVLLIGPMNHHSSLTKNPTFWEEDKTSLQWLENQTAGSVLYISFGSWVSPVNASKLRSLAMALLSLKTRFIWVLKTSWREGLPVRFEERAVHGKVVYWAPQMEILKHKAVGCYLTHCGWNSIMEAVQCRKRLLCYPVAGDQFLNCGYVVKLWRIGVKLSGFGEKEVEQGLRKVMEDTEINGRLMKLCEVMVGDEAISRVNSNLTTFINGVKMLPQKLPNELHDFY